MVVVAFFSLGHIVVGFNDEMVATWTGSGAEGRGTVRHEMLKALGMLPLGWGNFLRPYKGKHSVPTVLILLVILFRRFSQ
jgi:hypothetical protein